MHYPPSAIYSEHVAQTITNKEFIPTVAHLDSGASPWDILFFSYTTKVVMLGNAAASFEIGDLPILTVDMRATFHVCKLGQGHLGIPNLPKSITPDC
ncbi:hypothetical protein B0H19DRAFT_1257781 [Mycena capillaripes]|nr:hypothetical protein B0H19DRAFT_1257781 [Mycena capillaripes]